MIHEWIVLCDLASIDGTLYWSTDYQELINFQMKFLVKSAIVFLVPLSYMLQLQDSPHI